MEEKPDSEEMVKPDKKVRSERFIESDEDAFEIVKSKKFSDIDLIKAIHERGEKAEAFSYGILTADRYVKSVSQCIGHSACDKFLSAKDGDFGMLLKRAQNTLTYSNPEMILEENKPKNLTITDKDGDTLEMPKNTLMVFQHVLTTPRKDRDGDILRTAGAKPDPKMLMLFQHIHTLPIGKMMQVVDHNSKKLSVVTAIVDVSAVAHDSAVMVDNGMGRFSHGFRALSFSKMKENEGKPTQGDGPGFDVAEFEIMEESLVSVPANVDAETTDIIVTLAQRDKLTSDIMKSVSTGLREKMPAKEQVILDLKEAENEHETEGKSEENGKGKCLCGGESASKEENDDDSAGEKSAEVEEIAKTEKSGRVVSKRNIDVLKGISEDIKEIMEQETGLTRRGRAACEKCMKALDDVISLGLAKGDEAEKSISIQDAVKVIVTDASRLQRAKLLAILEPMEAAEREAAEFDLVRGLF